MDSYTLIATLLGVATALTVFLGWLLWAKSRCLAFPVGMVAVYFWTIHGGWSIAAACESGATTERLARLFDRLFSADVDDSYAWAIVLYAVFIVSVGVAALGAVARPRRTGGRPPIFVLLSRTLALSGIVGLASLACVFDLLMAAVQSGIPAYQITAVHGNSSILAVHQLLIRWAIVPAAIGCAIWAAGDSGRFLTGRADFAVGCGFVALLGGLGAVCGAMGNKNELLQALIAGVVFYLANARQPRYGLMAGLGVIMLGAIAYIDTLRGRSLEDVVSTLSLEELWASLIGVVETNEQFAAHLSMYGAVAYDIPLTYGSSIVSFIASAVPRALWPSRPAEIYEHYATAVNAVTDQGFTIHHATGWYLNFGIVGVVFGGSLFGWIWGKAFNRSRDPRCHASAARVCESSAFFALTGAIPMLLRTGPEGYKMMLLECIVFPMAVLMLSCTSTRADVAAVFNAARRFDGGPTLS